MPILILECFNLKTIYQLTPLSVPKVWLSRKHFTGEKINFAQFSGIKNDLLDIVLQITTCVFKTAKTV